MMENRANSHKLDEVVSGTTTVAMIVKDGVVIGTESQATAGYMVATKQAQKLFEINKYAVELAKSRTKNINIIQGSAFDVPFKDGYFDLVFTSGVLIHISPDEIAKAINEIYRCTNRYIWGFEYYADKYTKVKYRGHDELLWKADFADLYLESFGDMNVLKREKIKYLDNENVDEMFLLEKSG